MVKSYICGFRFLFSGWGHGARRVATGVGAGRESPRKAGALFVRCTPHALRRWDGSHRAPPRLDQPFCWSHPEMDPSADSVLELCDTECPRRPCGGCRSYRTLCPRALAWALEHNRFGPADTRQHFAISAEHGHRASRDV